MMECFSVGTFAKRVAVGETEQRKWQKELKRRWRKMADRSNARLNEAIEQHIAQWDGTVHGFCIKNMWENGADYESICEAANIDIEGYEDD
jgi:hypothetical protein